MIFTNTNNSTNNTRSKKLENHCCITVDLLYLRKSLIKILNWNHLQHFSFWTLRLSPKLCDIWALTCNIQTFALLEITFNETNSRFTINDKYSTPDWRQKCSLHITINCTRPVLNYAETEYTEHHDSEKMNGRRSRYEAQDEGTGPYLSRIYVAYNLRILIVNFDNSLLLVGRNAKKIDLKCNLEVQRLFLDYIFHLRGRLLSMDLLGLSKVYIPL